ncbi:MAG TPA: glucans biosynthesis glucosyltransferase MdoH [Hyphomicrobiaceae bacterium]|nr:glucans biosynthesis glucosyltransferase MdoH [Hyphomicrobiaceae bacterium]
MDQGLKRPVTAATGCGFPSIIPEPSGCQMPEQALWRHRRPQSGTRTKVRLARLTVLVLWLVATAAFAWTLYRVLSVETPTTLQIIFLVLSTLCFAWVAAGAASALVGFAALVCARNIDTLELPPPRPQGCAQTALLFPVYREDAAGVAALVDTMCQDLAATGAGDRFDVFILSDTQDAPERLLEQRIYGELRSRHEGRLQIYIRWRTPNEGKKAGNIRDWIEHFGARYLYFIILDADSIMSASTLLSLVAGMEDNPRAGLIQTVPRLVGGQSLFARLQQFAAGYYGPVVAAGLAAWHGHGGNYWGHNAIIRTRAFAESAGLPKLPGKPPRGGHILSHDFVEAALLRRARWEVHLVPSVEGTYEGCPPTLGDLIARDRRWAQGNLQHLRLLGASGLPFLSRVHLGMGALAYLASPVWALTLLIGVTLAFQAKYATPSYFGSEGSLFPKWPVFDAKTALALFFATVFVVHLPKLLGSIWAVRNAKQRKRNGGVARVVAGVLVESVFSALIAPVLMVTQTSAVLSILFGRDAGWGAQRRVEADVALFQLMKQHRWHLVWGAGGALVCAAISSAVLAWMSPIIVGLLLAPLIAVFSAQRTRGIWTALLAIPEERYPSSFLASSIARRAAWPAMAQKTTSPSQE